MAASGEEVKAARQPGRPRVRAEDSVARPLDFHIRFSNEEWNTLVAKAAMAGMPKSKWLRRLIKENI